MGSTYMYVVLARGQRANLNRIAMQLIDETRLQGIAEWPGVCSKSEIPLNSILPFVLTFYINGQIRCG